MITTTLLTAALLSTPSLAAQSSCSSKATPVADSGRTIVETALSAGSFGTLAAALKAGELVDALQGEGPFTVFAPTDAAFAKLPEKQLAELLKPENKALLQSILTYHVVPGAMPAAEVLKSPNATTLNGQRIDFRVTDAGAFVDGASITKTDIHCSNGVIHVIDTVILPSTTDVVGTAVEAGSFRTLAAALKAAGLVEALQGKGPFTVFAPSDEAFAALPEGTVANLLKPENKAQLTEILKLHVVPGRVYADQVLAGAKLQTLSGQELKARADKRGAWVNGAKITQTDVEASNGVIHVIASVLLPE